MKPTESPKSFFDSLREVANDFIWQPEARKQALGIEMQAPAESVHAQIAEELIAIQQRNSKGFRVIDVNPNLLSRADYYPQIPNDVLIEMFGPEGVTLLAGEYEDGVADNSSLPYWRTLELPISGNFLKIEHLPARVNDNRATYGGIGQIQATNTVVDNSDSFTDFSPKHSSDRVFLLHFQDTKENPILAKHGDTFETEFTSVFITFKTLQPRFRVTIGSNSKSTHNDDRLFNSRIAYAPGTGLFSNQTGHMVPFCITNKDLNAFQLSFFGTADYVTLQNTVPFNADLIQNVGNIINRCYKAGGANTDYMRAQYVSAGNYQFTNDQTSGACAVAGGNFTANNFSSDGMTIGWINSLSFSWGAQNEALTGTGITDIYLEIVRYTAAGNAVTVRRLLSLGNAGKYTQTHNMVKTPIEPVRFCLNPLDALRVAITTSGALIYAKFAIEGYTYGSLAGLGVVSGFPACPFASKLKVTENPYPNDFSTSGNPRY